MVYTNITNTHKHILAQTIPCSIFLFGHWLSQLRGSSYEGLTDVGAGLFVAPKRGLIGLKQN